MNCPGSIRLGQGIKNRGSSDAAELGTAAHALAEHCLNEGIKDAFECWGRYVDNADETVKDSIPYPADWDRSRNDLPPGVFLVDDDMCGAVNIYLEAVQAEYERLGELTSLNVERRFDLSWLRPDMFGTNDCSLVAPFVELVVMDYKHGQGVLVEVEENEQLMYYALGAAHDEGWDFEIITLIVVQPRAAHPDGPVRRWSFTVERLKQFATDLANAADRTREDNAPLKAGSWCKFCPASAICPELQEAVYSQAQDDFGEWFEAGPDVSNEELTTRAHMIPMIDAYIKSVETELLRRLKAGEKMPEHKLVRKKSNRKWDGDPKVILTAIAGQLNLPIESFQEEVKWKGPSKVEKLRPGAVKPKEIKALVAEYTTRPPGSITVASRNDPREELDVSSAAEADFDEFPVEEGDDG